MAVEGSYHNHLDYCDGAGRAVEYVAAATEAGLHSLGLSCHMPVPFLSEWNMPLDRLADYRAEVRAASATAGAPPLPPLYLGLEVDYLASDMVPDGEAFVRQHILPLGLDYVVVSMHYAGWFPHDSPWSGQAWAIDSDGDQFAAQMASLYGGDIRRLMEDYWARVAAMARQAGGWGLPVIAGHIDKAKMWNIGGRYFDEAAGWYLDAADAALAAIAAAGLVVEINTAGLTRPHGESYPGPRLLRRCRERHIPVTISADAHRPADVARRFPEAAAILRAAGHESIALLDGGRWVQTPLSADRAARGT